MKILAHTVNIPYLQLTFTVVLLKRKYVGLFHMTIEWENFDKFKIEFTLYTIVTKGSVYKLTK